MKQVGDAGQLVVSAIQRLQGFAPVNVEIRQLVVVKVERIQHRASRQAKRCQRGAVAGE